MIMITCSPNHAMYSMECRIPICHDAFSATKMASARLPEAHLLPDNAALRIVDIVHLVEDDPLDVPDDVSALVQHGPQDLRRHDEAGRLGLNAHIPCQEAHLPQTTIP